MREKTIEQKLVKAVKAMGGIAPKFINPGFGNRQHFLAPAKGRNTVRTLHLVRQSGNCLAGIADLQDVADIFGYEMRFAVDDDCPDLPSLIAEWDKVAHVDLLSLSPHVVFLCIIDNAIHNMW